tara:strand:+ start:621 stop:1787 length:1167 start_codon:yes stop_codon:yes gene_type:complete
MKIYVITSTRADFGILKNLILDLKKNKYFFVKLIVSGTHFSKVYGNTFKEINQSKLKIDYKIRNNYENDKPKLLSKVISKCILETSKILEKNKPDLLILLGDRYEILASAISCHLNRVPIAHIHGGEVTRGVIDDAFRHSITKLSHIHFVANNKYKRRVIQLGESPKKIFTVGNLSMDNVINTSYVNRYNLEKKLKIKFRNKNLLITFHPETLNKDSAEKQIDILLLSLKSFKDCGLLFTSTGADTEGQIINKKISEFCKQNENAFFFKSLGQKNYFSILKIVDTMIGNSSSGVIEFPYFKKPTINLGERQLGREMSKTILNVKINKNNIIQVLKKVLKNKNKKKNKDQNKPFKFSLSKNLSPSKKIIKVLKTINTNDLIKKTFFDLN